MRRNFGRGLLIFSLLAVNAVAQLGGVSPTQAPNITAPAPQKHNPPAQPQRENGVSKTAPAPVSTLHAPYTGKIEGFVYWDYSVISHKSTNACDDLSVTVSVGSSAGQFTPLSTLSNNFKYIGRSGTYAVCTYAFDNVPVGPELKVKVDVTDVSAFLPVSAPVPGLARPVNIINGKCNNLPTALPSPSELTSHWWTCGNYAYNVNFALQPSAVIRSESSRTGVLSGPASNQRTLLSNEPKKGMLEGGAPGIQPRATGTVQGNNPASKVELNPQPLPPGGKTSTAKSQKALTNTDVLKMVRAGVPESVVISTVQSGGKNFDFSPTGCRSLTAAHVSEGVLNAMGDGSVRPCMTAANTDASTPGSNVELNPQPLPPRTAAGAVPRTAEATGGEAGKRVEPLDPKLNLKLGPAVSGQQIKNSRVSERATLALATLQKQRSAADIEAAQMKLSLRPAVQSVALNGPSQTMSAGRMSTSSPTAPAPTLAMNNGTATSGPASISPAITHAPNINTTVVTCANNPAFRILTVSGNAGQATFTPIDQYNLYTITGCSFGNQDAKNKVYVYGAGTFQENFNIKFWSDNSIALSLNPSIRGYPDLDNLTLVIQRSDGQQTQKGGFKFYAARETVPLSTIPSSWVKLATLSYGFKTMEAQYSSPPATDPGPGPAGGSAYVRRFFNGQKFDPAGRYDVYDFSKLAPGWTTDSFQLNTYDQYCPYVVTYRQTFGAYKGMWEPHDVVAVWFADTTCSGFNPISPFLIQNYQNWTGSYYALQVWVNGPRGTDPFTDNRVQ